MTLEFDYHLHPRGGEKPGTLISYDQHWEYIDLYFHTLRCVHCGKDITYPERVAHALDHEVVEVLCNIIRYEQGEEAPICGCGFDHMALKWHKKVNIHKCPDGQSWKMITP